MFTYAKFTPQWTNFLRDTFIIHTESLNIFPFVQRELVNQVDF